MKVTPPNPAPLFLVLSVLAAIGLVAWPAEPDSVTTAPKPERYAGPMMQARNVGQPSGFPIRLGGGDTGEAETSAGVPLPTLAGTLGGQAYLRSGVTGEVKRIAVGEALDGWKLVAVSSRSARVVGLGGERRLEMFSTRRQVESVHQAGVKVEGER